MNVESELKLEIARLRLQIEALEGKMREWKKTAQELGDRVAELETELKEIRPSKSV